MISISELLFIVIAGAAINGAKKNVYVYVTSTCTMQPTLFWLAPGQAAAPTPGGTTQVVVSERLLGSKPMFDTFFEKIP